MEAQQWAARRGNDGSKPGDELERGHEPVRLIAPLRGKRAFGYLACVGTAELADTERAREAGIEARALFGEIRPRGDLMRGILSGDYGQRAHRAA